LFTRLVLEAPKITPSALEIIKSYCHDEVHVYLVIILLTEESRGDEMAVKWRAEELKWEFTKWGVCRNNGDKQNGE